MVVELSREKEEKVTMLARETGMELVFAKEYLESNGWDVETAIRGFKELQEKERKRPIRREGSPISERRIGRGLSISNLELVEEARKRLVESEMHAHDGELESFDCSAKTSFILPDINDFETEIGNFMKKDLIDANSFTNLHQVGRLNWWADIGACRKLFPLSTVGDGNCLLHAASLGMWGFHDRLLVLRKALYQLLRSNQAKGALKRRWKYALWKENMACGGLTYTKDEWEDEWEEVVKLASDRRYRIEDGKPKRKISRNSFYGVSRAGLQRSLSSSGQRELLVDEYLQSLEPIHVYALSNLLRRPIIIVADKMLKDIEGNPLAPIPFGGIYLPLECKPEHCYRYPLVLAYDSSHFSALVPAQGEEFSKNGEKLSTSVPLQDNDLALLPIKYTIDPGSVWDLVQDDSVREELQEYSFADRVNLLRKYMDIAEVPFREKPSGSRAKQIDAKSGTVNNIKHGNSVEKALGSLSEMFIGEVTDRVIAARLNIEHLPRYHQEMIDGYIDTARKRVFGSPTRTSPRSNVAASSSPRTDVTVTKSSSPQKSPSSPGLPSSPKSPSMFGSQERYAPAPQSPRTKKAATSPRLPSSSSSSAATVLLPPKAKSLPRLQTQPRPRTKPCAVPTCPNNAADEQHVYCPSCARLHGSADPMYQAQKPRLPSVQASSDGLVRRSGLTNSVPIDSQPKQAASKLQDRSSGAPVPGQRLPSNSGSSHESSYGLAIGVIKKQPEPVQPASQPRSVHVPVHHHTSPPTKGSRNLPPMPGYGVKGADDIPFVAGAVCKSPGCKFYGSTKTNGYCSYCFKTKSSSIER